MHASSESVEVVSPSLNVGRRRNRGVVSEGVSERRSGELPMAAITVNRICVSPVADPIGQTA